jgi:N-acetylmuramoyl-L-alanine amidase
MPGYRALLTRDGDYYVSFSRRLDVARLNAASLFISIHADAAKNRQAKGGSVYCLSTRGATNEAARLLAHNENLSDIIGGVPNGEGKNQSDEIILNMFQTNTINLSKTYATGLIEQLGRAHCLKYPVFQEAPFRVLKLLDTPAVLLETAFLSNDQEEKLLKTVKFRKTIASAVAASVANYFSNASSVAAISDTAKPGEDADPQAASPKTPADTAVEAPPVRKPVDADDSVKTNTYRVKRGDTLKRIAEKNETSLEVLLRLNSMKINDPLLIGRKILVPAARPESINEKPLKKYVLSIQSHLSSFDHLILGDYAAPYKYVTFRIILCDFG